MSVSINEPNQRDQGEVLRFALGFWPFGWMFGVRPFWMDCAYERVSDIKEPTRILALEVDDVEATSADTATQTQAALPLVKATDVANANAAPPGLLKDRPAQVDDLKLIGGVGPKLEAQLNALGLWQFQQLAAMSSSDLEWLDSQLPAPKGRPQRENWQAQAVELLSGKAPRAAIDRKAQGLKT